LNPAANRLTGQAAYSAMTKVWRGVHFTPLMRKTACPPTQIHRGCAKMLSFLGKNLVPMRKHA